VLDATPESGVDNPVGDRLELLLDQLARAGLKISTRDRMLAAALVADLVTRGQAPTFVALRPSLAPLLARSPADRERFFQVFDLLAPGSDRPRPDVEPRPTGAARRERSPWMWPLLGFCLVFAVTVLAWLYWPKPPASPVTPLVSIERPSIAPPTIQPTSQPTLSAFDTLNRIADAAERFEGAPTIEELSRELAKTSTIGWSALSYAIRLNELSGLPKTWPLALYGTQGRDGRIWAMLALALDRIERPGREPTFAELLTAANDTLNKRADPPRPLYDLASRLGRWLPAPVETDKAKLIAAIQERYHTEVAQREGKPTPGERLDEHTIQRALAISDDPRVRRIFADAPWMPPYPSSGAPWWAAWMAMLVPLVLAVLWLANSLTLRKAYLRRRPPQLPPLHLDIVSEAASRVLFAANLFQRIAQKLRLRTARTTDRLDLEASVQATIAAGGEIPMPVYQTVRHSPEYLVLIEQRSAGDQDAQRLRDLVRRLEALLPLTVFFYRTEPSRLEPERGGRSVSIEQLQAQYPEHRLLILGSGTGFLDPASLKPHPSAEKLTHWTQRALLTPLPLAEWGREEFALANELQLPVGRATPEGLLWLADNLGLEGAEADTLLDTRGDGLARPLPELLRVRPQRFLYTAPPSDIPVGEIVRDLRNFLDGPGFEWLCALAVYPAVQWDLTLFLGVSLPEQRGGNVTRAPLYREDRIAALTQLPWLREGIMPNWLRTALIGELDQPRQAEIREILQRLIDAAQLSGDVRRDDAVKLRISQEAAKDRVSPDQLMQDEVLLDFLARGKIEDFALPNASWLERFLPRGWLDRIGLPELAAATIAGLYAIVAWMLTPKAADGALVTGAWLPLLVLALGGFLAMAASSPATTYATARSLVFRAAPASLAFALVLTAAGASAQFPEIRPNPQASGSQWNYLWLPLLCAIWVLAGRWISERVGLPRTGSVSSWRLRVVYFSIEALIVLIAAVVAKELIEALAGRQSSSQLMGFAIAASIGFGVFAAAWVFARFLPERLPPPKPPPRGVRPTRFGGVLRPKLAAIPIIPAIALFAWTGTASIKLEPISGGATAVADLPGGTLIALGGADGIVRVYDTASTAGKPLHSIATGPAAISGLALRAERDGDASSPVALAVSTADGRVLLFDAKGGSPRQTPAALASLRGEGSKVHVAVLDNGRPAAVVEDAAGRSRLVFEEGTVELAEGVPATALAAMGGGQLTVATLDGRIRRARLTAGAQPTVDEPIEQRLPGRARAFTTPDAAGAFNAIGDDGTILPLARAGDRLVVAGQIKRDERLRLGAPVAWRRSAPQSAGRRVALVIGNADYRNEPKLRNPPNDARAMAEAFRVEGFDVILLRDGTRQQMSEVLQQLRARAEGAAAVVVFFSGHASTTATHSFLGPIDGDQNQLAETIGPSVSDEVLAAVAPAAGLKLVLIDSHGPGSTDSDLAASARVLNRECTANCFAPSRLPARTAVIFAAGPGTTALDGEGDNSPFTTALLKTLSRPDLTVRSLFDAVAAEVRGTTKGRQIPVLYTSLASERVTPLGTTGVVGEAAIADQQAPGTLIRDCPTCPEMIVVPAGSFMMGSPTTEEGRDSDEGPQHRVTFARPFAVGRFAVTFDEWDACVAGGGCNGHRPSDEGWGRGRRPVINVSWDDAKAYAAWLSRTTGQTYRLLTEAEREYVARAGTTSPFWWGPTITSEQANYDATRTYGKDGKTGEYRRQTVPVDSFQQNPWGLFNVHGNVWEWTEDCFVDNYNGAPSDGSARILDAGACTSRVVRGGSWGANPRGLRAAYRFRGTPDERGDALGFRLARTITP
jgi:formylglycine-generating enzyme required for sulfatase activity